MWIVNFFLFAYVGVALFILVSLYLSLLLVFGLAELVAFSVQSLSWPLSGKRWRCG